MREESLKPKLIETMVLLLPFLLVTGPFLSDLSLVLCCILIVFIKGNNLVSIISKNRIYKFIFIFYIYLVFCSLIIPLNEDYFLESFIPSFSYLRFLIFAIVFHYIFNFYYKFSKKLLFFLIIILAILFVDINLEYFLKTNLLGYKFNGVRIQSLFGDEWVVGSYLSKIVPIIVTLFLINKKKSKYIIFKIKYDDYFIFAILLIANFLVLLSGERSAFFSIAIYSILILFFLKFDANKKYLFILVLFFTFLISISVLKPTYERMYKHTFNQLNIFSTNYQKDHQLLFETGLKIFNDNKVIGSGLKGFRNKCNTDEYYINGGCSTHPHNFYILFLSELGFIGFLFLLTIFIILSLIIFLRITNFYFFKVNKKIFNNDILSILIGLYVFIFPLKTHGAFFNNWLSICFYLQLSLFIAIYCKKIKYYEKK